MSAPFVIAVPAKGRLQENAENFFARAGLELVKPRGARDYRGTIADLRALAEQAGIDLSAAIDLFESRTGFLAARGVDVTRIHFSTAFGRGFDYYTGFVFELHDPSGHVEGQLVAGGRYDGMLARLGASDAIPAVGFAVWIERLAALGRAA